MKNKILLGSALLSVLVFFIFYFNCTKKVTKYDFKKDYYLYTSGGFNPDPNKLIYVISTETDSVIDSIDIGPYNWPAYLALSPDKKTLYALVNIFDTTDYSFTSTYYEIDARTKALKYIGPNSSTVISPDGKYLFGAVGRDFTIFDAYTHRIIYQDTVFFSPVCFDKRAHLAYGATEKLGEIRIFNYETKHWIRSISIHLQDGRIPALDDYILSPIGNTLYFLARTYWDFYFCVYDLTQDSLLVQLGINSVGQLGLKSDGSTIYITDPGGGGPCVITDPAPTGKLGVFDTHANVPLAGISLDPLSDPPYVPPPLGPLFIRINPDGEKAYLTICRNRVLVIDIVRNEPLRVIFLPNEHATADIMAL